MGKPFTSVLRQEMENFFALREGQGHSVSGERHTLYTLDEFLVLKNYTQKDLPSDIIEEWLASLPQEMNVNTKAIYISHYCQFAKYLSSIGYTAFLPDSPMHDKKYMPHIFSKEDQARLIMAADEIFEFGTSKWKRCDAQFAVLLRILIGCGCRIGELILLETHDVDLVNGVLCLRNAKNDKDRFVPMHNSLISVLKIYVASGIPDPDGFFFPNSNGGHYGHNWAGNHFDRVLARAGIEKKELVKQRRNVCVHCLRHSFAVTSFRQLDQTGYDMYDEVPILSTYMGHEDIYGTEKYLHLTAENSADIMEKMDVFNAGMFPEVQE